MLNILPPPGASIISSILERVAPSEEPVALEPVVLEPTMPDPACPEWISCVQPSQWEVGTTGIQVVLQAEMPPEEACSKWSNLEG